MCTYLAKRGATYYFRFPIPLRLRPAFGGKAEIVQSLRTKDKERAKDLLPALTDAARAQLRAAESEIAKHTDAPENRSAPPSPRASEMERPRSEREVEALSRVDPEIAEQDARREARAELRATLEKRMKLSTQQLEPWEAAIKDLLSDKDFDLSIASDKIGYYQWRLQEAQKAGGMEALAVPPNAGVLAGDKPAGSGVMLHTTVVDRWAAERGVKPKGIDTHRAVARWFYDRVGEIPVADITRAHVIAFKDKLLEEGQSVPNINMKLSRLRTLLQWAADNDLAPTNAGQGISIKGVAAAGNKRLPFNETDLQAIFSSPVFAERARPKGGKGEAAYWLPLLALFTGARMEELGQLRPSDIQMLGYTDPDGAERSAWFINITTDVHP